MVFCPVFYRVSAILAFSLGSCVASSNRDSKAVAPAHSELSLRSGQSFRSMKPSVVSILKTSPMGVFFESNSERALKALPCLVVDNQ